MPWTFEATERGYANMWKSATLKGGADATNAETFANKIIAAEDRYKAVQKATGVPWYFIGALHMRESSCNFAGVLHNGEKIIGTGQVTKLEPDGRGPFATWQEAAIDALKLKNMHRVQSWPVARMLYQAEVFNGLGYVGKGVNSAYVWAGTNHEQPGKYVADHVWDGSADDKQLGVAAVLIRLAQKRPDIHADLYPVTQEKPPVDDTDQTTNKDLLNAINAMPDKIAAALMAAMKGAAPAPVVDPEPKPVPVPVVVPTPQPAPTPVLQQPGVGLGLVTGGLALIMQMLGMPVVGEGSTTATQALPAVAIGSAALGLSGWGGILAKAIPTLLSMAAGAAGGKAK